MININTVQTEKTICSSLLYDIQLMEQLYGILLAEYFFDDHCREIYVTLQNSYMLKQPVTDSIVLNKLPKLQDLIVEITSLTPVTMDTLQLLSDNVIKAFDNREMLKGIDEIKNSILEGREYSLDGLKRGSITSSSIMRTNSDIIEKMEDRINNPIKDCGTGIQDLDRYLNLEPGNLIVVAARPSMGKTALIITIILHLLKNNEGSAFFSLEMPSEAIMMRSLANDSGETLNNIRNDRIVNYKKYKETREKLSDSKNFIIIDDAVDHTQLYNIVMTIVKNNPSVKNVFIDHLTYIKDPGGFQNTHIRIGDVTKTLKRLAKDAHVKVWLLSQLSRSIESRPNRRPQLSDMRESGSIEEDADVIIGIYRDSYYSCREEAKREDPINEVELLVLKNRDGEVGGAKTMFIGPQVKFTDSANKYEGVATVTEYEDFENITDENREHNDSVSMPML